MVLVQSEGRLTEEYRINPFAFVAFAERQRQRARDRQRERQREREREREHACVRACVRARARVRERERVRETDRQTDRLRKKEGGLGGYGRIKSKRVKSLIWCDRQQLGSEPRSPALRDECSTAGLEGKTTEPDTKDTVHPGHTITQNKAGRRSLFLLVKHRETTNETSPI